VTTDDDAHRPPTPGHASWTTVGEVELHGGYRRVVERRFRDADGAETTFEIRTEPHGAAVVALTADHQVVLVEEFRPGPERWLLELPGGMVDDGEDAAQAAGRELLEETGYVATALVALPTFWASAYSTRRRSGFLALDCHRQPGWQPEPGGTPVTLPIGEFVAHVLDGELTDGESAMAALLALATSPKVQAAAGAEAVARVAAALANAWPAT
jgi:ADP-ribose pyrophosphatase